MNTQARWLVAEAGFKSPPRNFQVMSWPVNSEDLLGSSFVPLMTDPSHARRLADEINARGFGDPNDPIRFEAVHVDSPSTLSILLNDLRRLNHVEYVTIDLPEPKGGIIPADVLIPIAAAIFALDVAE